jgi:hypothetical protein
MSLLEINSILNTPNILSPLDSPSMMNSTIDQNFLTQSLIEHKKIVEALEKAIIESKNELTTFEQNMNENVVQHDTRLLEFLKENKEVIEPIIKEKYVELVNNLEEDKKMSESIENKREQLEVIESKEPEPTKKQSNGLFIIGSVILTGLLGYVAYSYFKKKD